MRNERDDIPDKEIYKLRARALWYAPRCDLFLVRLNCLPLDLAKVTKGLEDRYQLSPTSVRNACRQTAQKKFTAEGIVHGIGILAGAQLKIEHEVLPAFYFLKNLDDILERAGISKEELAGKLGWPIEVVNNLGLRKRVIKEVITHLKTLLPITDSDVSFSADDGEHSVAMPVLPESVVNLVRFDSLDWIKERAAYRAREPGSTVSIPLKVKTTA